MAVLSEDLTEDLLREPLMWFMAQFSSLGAIELKPSVLLQLLAKGFPQFHAMWTSLLTGQLTT